MLRNLFLMEKEITCLLKQDPNRWSRSNKWNLLTNVLVSFSNKLVLYDWKWRDAHHGYVESRQKQVRLREELAMKEKSYRDTQIEVCMRWETWRELKNHEVDEFSLQKFRECHETGKDELFEWLWRIPRSRVEFLWKMCTLSQSTSKKSKSAIYAELRQTFATWNMESTCTTGKHFCTSTFDARVIANTSSGKSSTCDTKCDRWGSRAHKHRSTCCKRWRTNWKHNPNADVCNWPSTIRSFGLVDFPQSSIVGKQRQQMSEIQFDKFPTPSSFWCWKIRFRNQVTACSDFPSEAVLWIKDVEMVDSMDEWKSSRSDAGKKFPNFEMLDAQIASALNKIIQDSTSRRRSVSRSRKPKKEGRFPRGRQIAFMIFDYFRVTGAHDTVLEYADLFSVAPHVDNVQEFDTR